MGTYYILPIVKDHYSTLERILRITKEIPNLYDLTGNLRNCKFEEVKNDILGEFFVFRTKEQGLAEKMRQELRNCDIDLMVLPLINASYPD